MFTTPPHHPAPLPSPTRAPSLHAPARSATPSPRLLQSLARFGLSLPRASHHPCALSHPPTSARHPLAPTVDQLLRLLESSDNPPRTILITGPSGSGKSTLLHLLTNALHNLPAWRTITLTPAPLAPQHLPIADLFHSDIDRMVRVLATAGLAEAPILARPAAHLSEGQRWRLALALALDQPSPPDPLPAPARLALFADEFCSTLDRITARNLARALPRSLAGGAGGATLIAATAHDDLAEHLAPDIHICVDLAARATISTNPLPATNPPRATDRGSARSVLPRSTNTSPLTTPTPTPSSLPFPIRPGTSAHLDSLLHLHYRHTSRAHNRPATLLRILTAFHDSNPIAVLAVSMPPLNASWRTAAWSPLTRFAHADNRARAAAINANLRTISRVIVDPRYRSLGVATSLVRQYLADPLTPATEAVALMGNASAFFRAAGMTELRAPISRADSAMLLHLQRAGIHPWQLVDTDRALTLIRAHQPTDLERRLRVWARASRATSALARADLRTLIDLAATRIASGPDRPRVYLRGTHHPFIPIAPATPD